MRIKRIGKSFIISYVAFFLLTISAAVVVIATQTSTTSLASSELETAETDAALKSKTVIRSGSSSEQNDIQKELSISATTVLKANGAGATSNIDEGGVLAFKDSTGTSTGSGGADTTTGTTHNDSTKKTTTTAPYIPPVTNSQSRSSLLEPSTGWKDFSQISLAQYANNNVILSTSGEHGAIRVSCHANHFNFDDPIVYPGQSGKAHLHMFFGNGGCVLDI